jgi:Ni,Fe-hydrogenase III small subunit
VSFQSVHARAAETCSREAYAICGPLSKYTHVDVSIAGCTPKPEAIIDGILKAAAILKRKREAMNNDNKEA